jgi:hypothetical protein
MISESPPFCFCMQSPAGKRGLALEFVIRFRFFLTSSKLPVRRLHR